MEFHRNCIWPENDLSLCSPDAPSGRCEAAEPLAVWKTLDDKQKAAASAHRNDRQGERHAEEAASSRAKTAELARLIGRGRISGGEPLALQPGTHGLRDVWSAAKKLDAAMKMS